MDEFVEGLARFLVVAGTALMNGLFLLLATLVLTALFGVNDALAAGLCLGSLFGGFLGSLAGRSDERNGE